MWAKPPFDPYEPPAENAVLEAVSNVVVKHLRTAESASQGVAMPLRYSSKSTGLEEHSCSRSRIISSPSF